MSFVAVGKMMKKNAWIAIDINNDDMHGAVSHSHSPQRKPQSAAS
jgi:hypothetical protein